ncbi:MAG: cation:proton antiporter [Pseudomonadota bacterium]
MSSEVFLHGCVLIAIGVFSLTFVLISVRIIAGPTLPDRILGLDALALAAIGFIAAISIQSGFFLYLDIAIALGLVSFLATVAFARFILKRDRPEQSVPAGSEPVSDSSQKPAPGSQGQ